ncbi:Methyltransferase-like protein 7A, variant 2 [Clonorchis sinensis]|uniref:Methyltransferase-like protein 7A, variant 2 n=1 Tax=Clonorchis sinensis TaxID=79923 RepID=A0A8T1MGT9_CLOSI|nr:Methyltransferase-like protein 7A, variant 2 [Clonorchis sinensis]
MLLNHTLWTLPQTQQPLHALTSLTHHVTSTGGFTLAMVHRGQCSSKGEQCSDLYLKAGAYIRIMEIGAADGLTLGNYPKDTQLVVVEPVNVFREAFNRKLATVNNAEPYSSTSNRSPDAHPRIALEAWYAVPAENILDKILSKADKLEEQERTTSTRPMDGQFDAFVSCFTLCSVHDLERVLTNATELVKPGGLILMLEHVPSPGLLMHIYCVCLQPIWGFLFGGCNLNRRSERYLLTHKKLCICWEQVFCEEFYTCHGFSFMPIRCTVGFVARRLPNT